jgi:xanthine dehydrogenase accessory factor
MGSGAGMNEIAALFRRGTELERDGVPYALVTVIRALAPASAKPGDKALVCADGTIFGWIGGGCAQPAVIRTVRQALADGVPRQIRVAPEKSAGEMLEDIIEFTMTCHSGGTIELFIDPILARPDLVLFGQSPVANALAGLGPRVGFRVTWVGGDGVDPEVACASRDELAQIRPGAYAVVATQGRGDLAGLRDALSISAAHIAFVASRRKGDLMKEALRDAGAAKADVDAIEAPAGEAIGARTPEEIALSVLAAVVARRRGRVGAAAADGDAMPLPLADATASSAVASTAPAVREARRAPSTVGAAPGKGSCCDS